MISFHTRNREWHVGLPLMAALLTLVGIAFIFSATTNFTEEQPRYGREGIMQCVWLGLSFIGCTVCALIPPNFWKQGAFFFFISAFAIQLMMWVLAGSSLVPSINGAHNWIRIGPLGIQPSEYIKIAVLIACARIVSSKSFDPTSFVHVCAALLCAAIPSAMMAKEDMGSSLTFIPMIIGVLVVAGMRLRHLAFFAVSGTALIFAAMQYLKDYQLARIDAWLHPEKYALTTSFQMIRALRSIGSGEWLGKGFGAGDQNRLGWLPEKHTDMIFGVIGEEMGFLRCLLILALYCCLGFVGLYTAGRCHDRFARLLVAGFTCLLIGQAAINVAVVLGLMPVTGITLPFFSYGGSSLLITWLGIGICVSVSGDRIEQFAR